MQTCLYLREGEAIMTKNILITGSQEQLGQELQVLVENQKQNLSDTNFYFSDRNSLDITDKANIETFSTTNTISIQLYIVPRIQQSTRLRRIKKLQIASTICQ